MRRFVFLLAFACAAFGQRHKLEEVDAEKPEGKLLQQIMQENDTGKKAALMEQFTGEFPKLEQTAWVLEQLQAMYVKANQPDQIIATGQKLLALDPDDPEAALQCLKAAEAKKDIPMIVSFSAKTSANARKMINAPKPADAEQVESWKNNVDYAKQVDTYAEYSIYRAGLESRDPKTTIELLELLVQRNPNSEYAAKTQQPLFLAYRQAGQNDKAIAMAEKVLATDQTNEDMLLVVTDNYAQNKKEPAKVHEYSAKIVEIMAAKPKPEGMADADWAARKNLITGLAHYMSGKLYASEGKHAQADTELRAALPLIADNMKPEVNFLLGLANYKMQKPQEAVTYFRACAAAASPFKAEANRNVLRIQQEYRGIK
jgi:tetratricopeptide (TPR) repeat protein